MKLDNALLKEALVAAAEEIGRLEKERDQAFAQAEAMEQQANEWKRKAEDMWTERGIAEAKCVRMKNERDEAHAALRKEMTRVDELTKALCGVLPYAETRAEDLDEARDVDASAFADADCAIAAVDAAKALVGMPPFAEVLAVALAVPLLTSDHAPSVGGSAPEAVTPAIRTSCAEWHCANDATGKCRRCGFGYCDAHMTERHGRTHEAEPLK